MRSHALAYLLSTRGNFDQVLVLSGGYKAFRKWTRLVYCYIPVNASYTFRITRPNDDVSTGKRKRDIQRQKSKSSKKNQKKLQKLQLLTAEGLEKRRVAMAEREARLTKEEQLKEQNTVALHHQEQQEWNETFANGPNIIIIGGRTGSGKTRVLRAMRDQLGCQIIDLEGLAHHNGSTFGFVGHGAQPTNQQYGNNVAVEWYKLDASRPVYVEDEGTAVGKVSTPVGLYRLMRTTSIVMKLIIPEKARIAVLLHDYTVVAKKDPMTGKLSEVWKQKMIASTKTLEKKLGKEKVNTLIKDLHQEDYAQFAKTALEYYDKLYDRHIQNSEGSGNGAGIRGATTLDVIVNEQCDDVDGVEVGRQVLNVLKNYKRD
jgi:tRNA 2-selenouridine synthase